MIYVCCILPFCLGLALGGCANISGLWRNELGSNMSLIQIQGDRITGRYSTSVESSKGAATYSTNISGLVHSKSNKSLVAFNVLYNHGASLTAWVGQCMVCDGKEKLFTTWVLRSQQPPISNWRSTVINQDTFWRILDTPAAPHQLQDSDAAEQNIGISGLWTSESGDSFNLTRAFTNGTLEGFTGKCPIYGSFAQNGTTKALGFASYNKKTIRGWAGQMYDDKVLETSWLTHSFSDNCRDPRHFVGFGMNNYTRDAFETNDV